MPPVRLPAEWEPQDGVLIAWPHAATDWADCLDRVEPVFVELSRVICARQRLLIATPEPERVRSRLAGAGIGGDNLRLANIPTNDTWCRDYGPLTILRGSRPQLLDFTFNAWGLKFAADRDNLVTRRLHRQGFFGEISLTVQDLVLEGGSIESDGGGTLLTTRRCLLHPNRNPHLSRGEIEARLCSRLGVDRIHWLEHGRLAGDDTDAHIDILARFAPDDTLLYVACDDPDDEHHDELAAMAEELSRLRTRGGGPYRLLPLPWPQAVYEGDRRLPATYANFLVINGAVLVPLYDDPADERALAVIAEAFPGREIIGIDARPLLVQGGSIHCLTMQLPQGVLP